jgi:hypothetical protein
LYITIIYIDYSLIFKNTENIGEKLKIPGIIFPTCFVLLMIVSFAGHRKNPEGKNFSAIFNTAGIIQDFFLDCVFLYSVYLNTLRLFAVRYVDNINLFKKSFVYTKILIYFYYYYLFSVTFFTVPIIFNAVLSYRIFTFELRNNGAFNSWFRRYPILASIFTILSAADIQILELLTSGFAGLTVFSAPFSDRSKKMIYWGSCVNILIEDIPQLIIQIMYYCSVVNYDILSLLGLISNTILIVNKIILKSYEELAKEDVSSEQYLLEIIDKYL